MSRSKTLIRYQQGYCGQPADIEAMKPREARAYCLGVGHVAAGTLPLPSGADVLAALTTRRRDGGETTKCIHDFKHVGDGFTKVCLHCNVSIHAPCGEHPPLGIGKGGTFPLTLESEGRSKVKCIKALRDVAHSLNISRDLQFLFSTMRSLPSTFYCRSAAERSLAVQALRASGAIVTIPVPKGTPS